MINKMKVQGFLERALIPYTHNPGWNIDAVITIVGLAVWSIITIGVAFGLCHSMPEIQNLGTMLFSFGAGRASKDSKSGGKS